MAKCVVMTMMILTEGENEKLFVEEERRNSVSIRESAVIETGRRSVCVSSRCMLSRSDHSEREKDISTAWGEREGKNQLIFFSVSFDFSSVCVCCDDKWDDSLTLFRSGDRHNRRLFVCSKFSGEDHHILICNSSSKDFGQFERLWPD